MKYYRVTAKCGHVGKNNYILKDFYVCACNGREAALEVRWRARVKHHHKDAIREVVEINEEEYVAGNLENNLDMYFQATCIQDQRLTCDLSQTIHTEIHEETRKKNYSHSRQRIADIETIKEFMQGEMQYE